MASFGVLIAFLSPKQSEIEKSSLESISKSRIQGVWDPALYIRLPPLYIQNSVTAAIPPGWHPKFCCHRHSIWMSYIRNSGAGWERRAFQLPRLDISGSDDSAYPENFAAILHSVAVFSWSFPICATDILRYFALDNCCLNPQTLLVTHQLQDSLVIKFGKRVNNLKIFCFVIFYIYTLGSLFSRGGTTHLLYSFQRKKNTELCFALPSHFDCIFLLVKQALRMFPQSMGG